MGEKIAIITDTHFGARNDSQIFMDYFREFYEKVFFPTLADRGIRTCYHLGDLVDRRKYINFNVLSQIKKCFIDRIVEEGIRLEILVGNHDVPYRNTNQLNSITELFGKYSKDQIHYHWEPTVVEECGSPILLLPWINQENLAASLALLSNSSAQLVMGHLEIQGFRMNGGEENKDGLSRALFERFPLVMSGHFHSKSASGNISYLGAPYEMTFSDLDDQKGFHILDLETLDLEFIPNPSKLFHRVYYNDDGRKYSEVVQKDWSHLAGKYVRVVVEKRKNQYWYEKFLDAVNAVAPANVSVFDLSEIKALEVDATVEGLDQSKDTITLLQDHIDGMPDTDEAFRLGLKELVLSLHHEALESDAALIG